MTVALQALLVAIVWFTVCVLFMGGALLVAATRHAVREAKRQADEREAGESS